MRTTTLVAAAFLAVACSKNNHPAEPTAQDVKTGKTYQAPPDNDTVFDDAFGAVAEGADEVKDAAGWTFEKVEHGAVAVGRTAKKVGGTAVSETNEAALAASVQGRLAAADDVPAKDIQIEVYRSEVTLSGHVGSRAEAAKAVRVALNTRGVDRVVSRLTW